MGERGLRQRFPPGSSECYRIVLGTRMVQFIAPLGGIQDGFKLIADGYPSGCGRAVKGFKRAISPNKGREGLSGEVVGFFMEIPPARLVEGRVRG